MRYLVDANVLSEPTKPFPRPKVVAWLSSNERELAIDPIILGELRFGILLLPKGKRRARLESWFDAGARRLHWLRGRRRPVSAGRSCSPSCAPPVWRCRSKTV